MGDSPGNRILAECHDVNLKQCGGFFRTDDIAVGPDMVQVYQVDDRQGLHPLIDQRTRSVGRSCVFTLLQQRTSSGAADPVLVDNRQRGHLLSDLIFGRKGIAEVKCSWLDVLSGGHPVSAQRIAINIGDEG